MDKKWIGTASTLLFILLIIMAVQLGQEKQGQITPLGDDERYPLLKIEKSSIAGISLKSPGLNFVLKKREVNGNYYFVVQEKNDYPVDDLAVENLLDSLTKLTLLRRVKSDERMIAEYGLQDPLIITLSDEKNKELARLFVGKKSSGGHFVRLKEDGDIYVGKEPVVFPENIDDWIHFYYPAIAMAEINSIDFSFPRQGNTVYSAGRTNSTAPLTFSDKDVNADTSEIAGLLRNLQVENLCSEEWKKAGLDKPVQIVDYNLAGGSKISVLLGNVVNQQKDELVRRRYASIKFIPGETIKKENEGIYREWQKRSGNHVLLLEITQGFALMNIRAPLIPGLISDKVVELTLNQKEQAVKLQKKDNQWQVAGNYNFQADQQIVQNFIRDLANISCRPGDIANPKIDDEKYHNPAGNISFSLKHEDNTIIKFTQCKKRESKDKKFAVDDIADSIDTIGNYYIKPTGELTYGASSYSIHMDLAHWLHKTIVKWQEKDIAEMKVQLPEHKKEVTWVGKDGKLIADTSDLEIKNRPLALALANLEIADVVKENDQETAKLCWEKTTVLSVQARNQNGMVVNIDFKNSDGKGYRYALVKASYHEQVEKKEEKEEKDEKKKAEDEKKKQEEKAAVLKEIEQFNKIYHERIVQFDYDSANKFFLWPAPFKAYYPEQFTKITLQKGKQLLEMAKQEKEWKSGEDYIDTKTVEKFFDVFMTLDLRQGALIASDEQPEISIHLEGKEKNIFKIGKEVQFSGIAEAYRFIDLNGRRFMIKSNAIKIEMDRNKWLDQRVLRLDGKKVLSAVIKHPAQKIEHRFEKKDDKLQYPDLAPSHEMTVNLEIMFTELFKEITKDKLIDQKTVKLPNTFTIELDDKTRIEMKTSEEEDRKVYLTMNGSAELDKLFQNKLAHVKSSVFKKFYRKRSLLECVHVYTSHILVSWLGSERSQEKRTKEEARKRIEEVEKKLKEKPESFGELAKEYSDEPGAKFSQGRLPIAVKPGDNKLAKEYCDAALKLKIGEMSSIVESKFGFHIIRRDR